MIELPFVFEALVPVEACKRCFDTGIWLTPRNEVAVCPSVQIGQAHAEPNEAGLILRRAVNRLFEMKHFINSQAFDLARLLTNFTSAEPCPRQEIFETFYGDTNLTANHQLRKFHALVEELRNVWLLPVGSRKAEPCGYWIITDLEDYKAWFLRTKTAPITQLSTIHRNARHNFPVFAEQMELEFWRDLKGEENEKS